MIPGFLTLGLIYFLIQVASYGLNFWAPAAGIFANHTTFLIVALGLLGAGIIASIPSLWTLPPKLLVGAGADVGGAAEAPYAR